MLYIQHINEIMGWKSSLSPPLAMQAHSNASEYMPLLLLLIAMLEAGGGTSARILHLYGKPIATLV